MSNLMFNRKEYLGDAAYVTYDGYHVVLTAEDGEFILDKIALESHVLSNFLDYVERLKNSFVPTTQASKEIEQQ